MIIFDIQPEHGNRILMDGFPGVIVIGQKTPLDRDVVQQGLGDRRFFGVGRVHDRDDGLAEEAEPGRGAYAGVELSGRAAGREDAVQQLLCGQGVDGRLERGRWPFHHETASASAATATTRSGSSVR